MNQPAPQSLSSNVPRASLALRFISGKYQGGEVELPLNGELVIGRSSELEMVLVEDMVSRRHAKITVEKGKVFLEDLGSTNGSFVNGERINKAELREGDRVLIGTSIIKVVSAGAAANAARASSRPPPQMSQDPGTMTAMTNSSNLRTMTGAIAEVSIPDLLQLFGASRKTGMLIVGNDGDEGRIYMVNGQVEFASINNDETVPPEKAFFQMLFWQTGTFDMMTSDRRDFPATMKLSNEGLLMEGMRQLDEINRLSDVLPPFKSVLRMPTTMNVKLSDATPEELDVLQVVMQSRNFGDVLNRSPKDNHVIAGIVAELIRKGYLVAS